MLLGGSSRDAVEERSVSTLPEIASNHGSVVSGQAPPRSDFDLEVVEEKEHVHRYTAS
jgi:hypothetical protein